MSGRAGISPLSSLWRNPGTPTPPKAPIHSPPDPSATAGSPDRCQPPRPRSPRSASTEHLSIHPVNSSEHHPLCRCSPGSADAETGTPPSFPHGVPSLSKERPQKITRQCVKEGLKERQAQGLQERRRGPDSACRSGRLLLERGIWSRNLKE